MSKVFLISETMKNMSIMSPPYQDPVERDKYLQETESNQRFDLDSINFSFEPVSHGSFPPTHQVSERSIRLLEIIGGFVLLLLFLAFITCVRQRKLYEGYSRGNLRNRTVYYQLQQLQRVQRCNVYMTTVMIEHPREVPPDYNTVVSMDELELPSYIQAVGSDNG
eukprot:GFUD01012315.1.p1 GENE.GFUD01012315.1~~GFUD01012315.1.p1  ORF type:complete len:165 (-),score=21.92 GFUD01012315.1:57-551(-)